MKSIALCSTVLSLLATLSAGAASLSLASTMNGNSYLYEAAYTGGYSRINLGNGGPRDNDGHYTLTPGYNPATDPTPTAVGSGFDTFPRESQFLVGTLTFNESLVSMVGTSIVPIDSIDLGEFWKSDPNRTNSSFGSLPTVVSDISDHALGLWFFNMAGGISFGALDANDTLTFTNGVLTSIDLSIGTTFTAGSFTWNGTFSVSGDDISYQINQSTPIPFQANLNGVVNSVGVYAVPEPATGVLACLITIPALLRRRRTSAA